MPLKLPPLVRNTGWQAFAYLAPTLASIALTPYVLQRIGIARYGEYALVLIGVSLFANLDGGITLTVQRWILNYSAHGDRAAVTRALFTGALCAIVFGGLLSTGAYCGRSLILQGVNIPVELRHETSLVLPMIGLLLALSLLNALPQALLASEGRFRTITVLSILRTVVQFGGTIFALEQNAGVRGLLAANALSFVVSLGCGFALSLHSITFSRRLFLTSTELRAFMRFASRMQVTSVAVLINVQLDGLVLAAIAPIRFVGMYAIAANVATAMRALPLAAMRPIYVRFCRGFAEGLALGAAAELDRLHRRWMTSVVGYVAVGTASLPQAVPLWLGTSNRMTGLLAAAVFLGFGVNLLTGPGTAFVTAIGRPGLETRYALWCAAVNLAITIPLGLTLGVFGVVLATMIGSVIGSLYFFRVLQCAFNINIISVMRPGASICFMSALAAAAPPILVGGLAERVGAQGLLGLTIAASGALVGLCLYAFLLRGVLLPDSTRLRQVGERKRRVHS